MQHSMSDKRTANSVEIMVFKNGAGSRLLFKNKSINSDCTGSIASAESMRSLVIAVTFGHESPT